MLKKSLLANIKAFKVSIGAQTYCTVSSNKAFASPGEIVTLTVSYPTGYSNATVSVSPSVAVSKVNTNTYTFVMPSSDVTITASASVLSFSIYVNKSGSGTVNVKSIANYGERVTVTFSPGQNYELGSVSASGASLSGSGNTRTFTMPANSVTINVQFTEIECWITIGKGFADHYMRGFYDGKLGSVNRKPYWYNDKSKYLRALGSLSYQTTDEDYNYYTVYMRYAWLYNSSNTVDPALIPATVYFTDGTSIRIERDFSDSDSSLSDAFTKHDGQQAKVVFNTAPSGYL